jgi:hypothetical protein
MAPTVCSGRRERAAGASFGDRLPDQLGDVEDQIRSGLARLASIANLTCAYADHVVEPAVGLAVGRVKQRAYDLTALGKTLPGHRHSLAASGERAARDGASATPDRDLPRLDRRLLGGRGASGRPADPEPPPVLNDCARKNQGAPEKQDPGCDPGER